MPPPLVRAVQYLRRMARPPGDPAADRQLLAAFAAHHDDDAFAELVRRHGPLVMGVCRRVLGDAHAAEDAFQATFLVLARHAGSRRWRSAIGPWLYGVAYRLAHKARRAETRRCRHERQVPPPTPADPLADVAWRDLRRRLDDELARLPERVRAPLVLCYLDGLTRDEAARRLGWTLATLKRRLERGRAILRARLGPCDLSPLLLPAALERPAVSWATALTMAETARTYLTGGAVATAVGALIEGTGSTLAAKSALAVGLLVTAGALAVGTTRLAMPAETQAPPIAAKAGAATLVVQPDRVNDPLPQGAVARLGTLAFRHGDHVFQVLTAPDGRTVFSRSTYVIRIWQADSGREDGAIFSPVPTHIRGCSLLPDGNALAISYGDGSVHLWDWRTRRELRTLDRRLPQTGRSMFAGYVHSPDGRWIVTVDDNGSVAVLNLATGQNELELNQPHDGATAIAFAPDGKTLLIACRDKSVRVWDVATHKEVRAYTGLADAVKTLALSPDGRWLATVGGHVLDVGGEFRGHVLRQEKAVRVWDLTTSREVHQLDVGEYGVAGLMFSPDSRSLITGQHAFDGHNVRQWDVQTGQKVRDFVGAGGAVVALCFAPDGKSLVTADSVVHIWDWQSGRERLDPAGHDSAVATAVFLPDGKSVVTAGSSGTICQWDTASGRELRHFSGFDGIVFGLALSPDGRTLAYASRTAESAFDLAVWDLASGRRIRQLHSSANPIMSPVFSPDGRLLAAGCSGDQKAARFWDTVTVWDTATWQERHAVEVRSAANLSLTPDGRTLLGVGVAGAFAIDMTTGKLDLRLPTDQIGSTLAYSADGKLLASAGSPSLPPGAIPPAVHIGPGGREYTGIRLFDVAARRKLRELPLGHDVALLAFSPDGRLLASASSAEKPLVSIWDVTTGLFLRDFAGHRGRVSALAFSPDGKRLISGGCDTTALVWDVSAAGAPSR